MWLVMYLKIQEETRGENQTLKKNPKQQTTKTKQK